MTYRDDKPRCEICAKRITVETPGMAHLRTDGTWFAQGSDPIIEGSPSDQGWFEVGPECLRRIAKAGISGWSARSPREIAAEAMFKCRNYTPVERIER